MKTIKLFVFLLGVIILTGCKKDKKSAPVSPPVSTNQNVLNSNAHIVDTSAIANMTATSVTFNKSNMSFTPAVGDILLASPSAKDTLGLFVKVLRVTVNGSAINCTTQISNLNDAFKELYINYSYTGAYSATAQANVLNQHVLHPIIGNTFAATSGTTLAIPFNNKNIGGFILNGNLQLNIPDTRIKYVKMQGATLPDTVLIAADINTNPSQLQITSPTLNLNGLTLLTFNLPTLFVPVAIGPVVIPIPFTQTIKINVLPAAITGKMSFTVLPQISATLGLSYENGTWKNLSTYSIGASADSLIENNFSASVKATATIFNPVYTIAPLGSDANNLFFEIPNDLGLTIQTATPNYLLTYNLGVTIGINASFWDGLVQDQLTVGGALYTDTLLKGNFKTVLLSKVIDNTPMDPQYGQIVEEFTYNGKQLVKAVHYDDDTHFEIDLFNYNSQGQLIGTTLSYSTNGVVTAGGSGTSATDLDVRSTITFNGNNISEIKFYLAGDVPDQDIKFTYQGGNLTNWLNTYNDYSTNFTTISQGEIYQYNRTNQNTSDIEQLAPPNQPLNVNNGGEINLTFDNKNNLTQALPFWTYLIVDNGVYNNFIPNIFTSGSNNVIDFNAVSAGIAGLNQPPGAVQGSGSYSYQYNNYGYPSVITENYTVAASFNNGVPIVDPPIIYKFEYIQVN